MYCQYFEWLPTVVFGMFTPGPTRANDSSRRSFTFVAVGEKLMVADADAASSRMQYKPGDENPTGTSLR
jgi:hypothetical protein